MSRIANKVIRQIARDLGSEDAPGKLAELASFLQGLPNAPEGMDSILAGLPQFFNTVMETYSQYEEQNKVAVRNIQLSSLELNQLNRKLEFFNGSMNAMLESLGQGLMFFDNQGLCSPVYSKSCIALLETEPAGKFVWDILGLSSDEAQHLKTLISLLMGNMSALSFEDLVELAPAFKTHSDGRKIHLEYRPMYGGGQTINGVLVIATDRSEEEKSRALLQQKEQEAARILRLARNRNVFQKFITEVQDYFLSGTKSEFMAEDDLESIKRALHTFKGLSGTFFMHDLSQSLHHLEDMLTTDINLFEAKKIIEEKAELFETQMRSMIEEAENLFGKGFIGQGQTRNLSLETLGRFHNRYLQNLPDEAPRREFMREFMATPLWRKLEFFNAQILDTAERLGKKVESCHFEGENFPILEAPYQGFFTSLTHVASNIVDHAFEPEDTRLNQGKPAAGRVWITTQQKDGYFTIQIRDDGAGISEDKVRERLGRKGVDTNGMSKQDILMAIFQPDFSTASAVTATSGRGVGLNVVYDEIQQLNGKIAIDSEAGKGTTLIFTLPLIWA
ncbi:MAG TPA: ATP-binding protein [Alphaproteobacteria bacterium]|nr:ATP-binding protein [Alphaproteobacteria bacterium]